MRAVKAAIITAGAAAFLLVIFTAILVAVISHDYWSCSSPTALTNQI